MMIRSMSPRIILTDEIGRPEDAAAIEEALNAGITIITSAHAADLQDALARPFLSRILERRIFERIAVLGDSLGVGTLEKIYAEDYSSQLLNRPIR
jgi:stage III sporulation protein AA